MSGATTTWLSRQRKSDLTELAQHTGLKNYESLKKTELELALDEYLAENSNQFSSDSKLAPYYSSRAKAAGSPVKKDAEVTDKLRVAKRRATKSVEDLVNQDSESEPTAISSALVQTPGRALSLAQRIPLPATPADVANAVDRSTQAVRVRAASIYKESGITEATNATRESLSSVTSVLFLISAFELYFLRPELLTDRYAFTFPAISLLGTKDYPVFVPDLFLLLTSSFWNPALLWAFTSTILPTLAGYFVNLTTGAHHGRVTRRTAPAPDYVVDPLTFSVVKAVISFVVYGQGVTFGGWVSPSSIERINTAVYGGYKGVLVGSAITALFSIYDAVNIPKTRKTYCKGKECKKHTQHKVTQYKAGKASLFAQGKRRYDRKQSGYGGQTKPVFHKKAKTTKKVVLRLECVACKTKLQLALKRCKHFELGGDKKTKGAALVF
ncbi:uncharacterized protein B0I36DRAFT_365632 [Microdochium trichocladiopsis]|uniref:60S ribosomal protein L44 n=1 Tax=Microdochium trichocladiopsis TaxID=1682393 RepID=A0A9P8Y2I9_9PEZI|nr:uncharacterized protein B0I36DRAFT_365632 [Microdochium trichocladiopsis]KAH7026002.1 hypothetical protein B0I36DRAFT_365632 [Microdochium trichocladiopsis]